MFFIEPLFYHNAIIFERYGFAYCAGGFDAVTMQSSSRAAASRAADRRQPVPNAGRMADLLPRSWAIHDILGRPFTESRCTSA